MHFYKYLLSIIIFLASLVSLSAQEIKNIAEADSITLLVSFVVKKDGVLSNFNVEEMHCPGCTEETRGNITKEVIRTIQAQGPWERTDKGTKIYLPVRFKYNDVEKVNEDKGN